MNITEEVVVGGITPDKISSFAMKSGLRESIITGAIDLKTLANSFKSIIPIEDNIERNLSILNQDEVDRQIHKVIKNFVRVIRPILQNSNSAEYEELKCIIEALYSKYVK